MAFLRIEGEVLAVTVKGDVAWDCPGQGKVCAYTKPSACWIAFASGIVSLWSCVCNYGRSWNKTLNDLSRTDKNSRNSCRYITFYLYKKHMHLRSLLTGNTKWALSHAAVEWLHGKVPAAPRAVFCCPCSACDTHPWNHLNRHSFFCSPSLSLTQFLLQFLFTY